MSDDEKQTLVELARQRGFSVNDGMTEEELLRLLERTPPTAAQLDYLFDLIGHKVPVPTFGVARQLLNAFEDLRNTEVLYRYDWSEGDILQWRDSYWRIVRIFTHPLSNHRFQIEPVDLEPGDSGTVKVVRRKSRSDRHNPRTLSTTGARKVDVSQWPVELVVYPDDEDMA